MTNASDHPDSGSATGPMTFEAGVASIADLVADEVQEKEKPARATGGTKTAEPPASDAGNESPDTDTGTQDAGEPDAEPEQQEAEGPEGDAIDLPDETRVEIGDNEYITLGELKGLHGNLQKRIADFQRGFTEKTTEIAERHRVFEEQENKVLAHAHQLAQERAALAEYARRIIPQSPSRELLESDPMGFVQQREAYDAAMNDLNAIQAQAERDRQEAAARQSAQMAQVVQREREALFARFPELREAKKAAEVKGELVEFFGEYGLRPDEVANIADSRAVAIMLDFMQLQKKTSAAPQKAAEKIAGKPAPVLKAGKRSDPAFSKKTAAAKRVDRLRRSGSFEDGVAAILDVID